MNICARMLSLILLTAVLSVGQKTQNQSAPPTFRAQSDLVMVPFRVERGKQYVTGLSRGDVLLLEDGQARDFSVFEPPDMGHTPLELVLLFDTTDFSVGHVKPSGSYNEGISEVRGVAKHWDEAMSEAVLVGVGAEIRVSVYHFDGMQLERLTRPTSDPEILSQAFNRLAAPIPVVKDKLTPSQRKQLDVMADAAAGRLPVSAVLKQWWLPWVDQPGAVAAGEAIPLEVPANRGIIPWYSAGVFGVKGWNWPLEAAIGTLQDSSAERGTVLRSMVMFCLHGDGATTVAEDVVEQSQSLGIPIYPVMTHAGDGNDRFWNSGAPNKLWTQELGRLGEMTGGHSFIPSPGIRGGGIDAAFVRDLLKTIRNESLSQYVVGFMPQTAGAVKEHKLEVKLASEFAGKVTGGTRQAIY
jgi:hypothetical protein